MLDRLGIVPDTQAAADSPAAALRAAERSGFRVLLIGRSIVLAVVVAKSLPAIWVYGNASGAVLAGVLLALGLFVYRTIGTAAERAWHRYALVALDIGVLAAAAIYLPLWSGGDVPRIYVFRAYGTYLCWTLLAVSALSVSPPLILFAGTSLGAALWAVFAAALAQMPETRSWSDLPAGASAQDYIALLLDARFVATGNLVQETGALLLAAGILAAAIHRSRRIVLAHHAETSRRRQVERVFGRYVPSEVARQILDEPGLLRPVVRQASVLFLDVARFTEFSATRPPDIVLATLGNLLGAISGEIAKRGGIVIGYGGDSLLATFGAPVPLANHAESAVAAALAVLDGEALRASALSVRIGIATGEIAAGTIGDATKQSYTVYGATVNRAQRLEQENKAHATQLIIDEATLAQSGSAAGFAAIGAVRLRGFSETTTLFARRQTPEP